MTSEDRNKYESLLASMSDDSEIQGKMDEFASTRQRSMRIEKARKASQQFQQAYGSDSEEKTTDEPEAESVSSASGEAEIPSFANRSNRTQSTQEQTIPEVEGDKTIIAGVPAAPEDEGGTKVIDLTRRYDNSAIEQDTETDKTHTVVMSNDEIQNLLDQDDEPLLHREYVKSREEDLEPDEDDDDEDYEYEKVRYHKGKRDAVRKSEPHDGGSKTRTLMIVLCCLLAAVLIGCAVVFIPQMLNRGEEIRQEDSEKLEARLTDWIESAGDDQETLLKTVQQYEKDYNNLDDEGKRRINELLMASTGKTFNELLAAAKNQKDDSSNNNTQIAEMKAKLKSQISDLNSQINDVQTRLDQARNQISQAYTTYTNDSTNVQNLQANAGNANSNLDRLNSEKSTLENQIRSDSTTLEAVKSQIESLQDKEDPDDEDKKQLANLQAQQGDLESSIAQAQSRLDQLPGEIRSALDEANSLNSQLQDAQNRLNESSAAYDSIKNSDKDLETQLSNLTSQRDALQEQLDSIK